MEPNSRERLLVLDGWRGISILLVLATHLLPLGPKSWELNQTAGPMGMSLFFTLSGFLITNFLLHKTSVVDFLIRRLFRIIPLAWIYILICLSITGVASSNIWLEHLLFYSNWPPMTLQQTTSHFWSLDVEMQFYMGIALIFFLFGKRGLYTIPILAISFTLYRFSNEVTVAVNTYYRIDEILAGGIVALLYDSRYWNSISELRASIFHYLTLGILFILSSHPDFELINYLRPYLGASLVLISLFDKKSLLIPILKHPWLAYIGAISYALYVIHGGLRYTWLGSGETFEKYLKRPLLFIVLFALSHLSTFYYERKFISLGKHLSHKWLAYLQLKKQPDKPLPESGNSR